ncbi:MAG TPA: phage major capsid protein [Candidatus Acidoferrum sp.]|nr:phage major capsid protein [Candidatus Acidoferrum sp.]
MNSLNDQQFQESVLREVNAVGEKFQAVERNQETLLRNYDQLGRETKQSLEDITRLKNSANDRGQILGAIQKLQRQLRYEAVAAGLDPIQRIANDPEKRARLNLAVRLVVDRNGDLRPAIEPLAKAIGEDTGEGATLIIAQLFKEIYDTLAQYGDWSTLGVRRLGTKVTNFPIKTARTIAQWLTSEASPIPDDTSEAGNTLTLTVLPNAVLLNVSRQLIEDAEFDVTSMVMEDFQEAWNLRLDTAAFAGNGAADGNNGGFTGLFNAGNKATAAQGNTTVAALDYDDVARCLTTVAPVVLRRRPRWWMHPQMLVKMLGIKDNNGRPIFLGALEAPSYGAIGTILGYPVVPVMAAPNNDGAGALVAAFGDRNGQVVGVRDDFAFEASDHYRWNTLERSFRAYGRAATGCRRADAFAILQTAAH